MAGTYVSLGCYWQLMGCGAVIICPHGYFFNYFRTQQAFDYFYAYSAGFVCVRVVHGGHVFFIVDDAARVSCGSCSGDGLGHAAGGAWIGLPAVSCLWRRG